MSGWRVAVCVSPLALSAFEVEGWVAVVVDVWRATTTIVTALANGARAVMPVATIEEAFRYRELYDRDVLLAGEERGQPIEGFDLYNSPRLFTAEVVRGKKIVLRTTNGTQAIAGLKGKARAVLAASFVNLSAVARYVAEHFMGAPVLIVCGGWRGHLNLEDTTCAGAILHRLGEGSQLDFVGDEPVVALWLWERAVEEGLEEFLKKGTHWRRLTQLGWGEDLSWCLRRDVYPHVVQLRDEGFVCVDSD